MLNKNIDNGILPDWIELYILEEGYISKSDLYGEFSDLDDSDIEDLFIVLSNRLFLYGSDKPYDIIGDKIVSKLGTASSHKRESYEFSLFLSVYGNSFKTQEAGKIFERLSNEAYRKYLGGESRVFGFPDGLTGGLKNKIDELATEINERRGSMDPLVHSKDSKLDLISYKPIDNRHNKIIFLVQSSAGKNWKQKLNELSINLWSRYINFGVTPIRGFSTPIFIDDKEEFYEKGVISGLIFDRPRIYNFISQISTFIDTDLEDDLINWNKSAIINYS